MDETKNEPIDEALRLLREAQSLMTVPDSDGVTWTWAIPPEKQTAADRWTADVLRLARTRAA